MSFHIKQSESTSAENLYLKVNNPGQGDCGFYAFATGFISVVQAEFFKGNKNPSQLETLNKLRTKLEKYEPQEFINFDYNLSKETDIFLLEKLKSDLRSILYNQYLQEIYQGSVIIEGENSIRKSLVYMQFLEIFYFYHHGSYFYQETNLLFNTVEIRQFAELLAQQFKKTTDPHQLELLVQARFMSDLYGEDYLSKIQIPWDETTQMVNDYLPLKEKNIILLFKQFKMVVLDLYNKSFTTLKLAPNFNFRNQSLACAKMMRENKTSLHQRVKLVVSQNPLNQRDLEKGALYIQLIDVKKNIVRVYSPSLDNSHNYTPVKAENLINTIRHKCPNFKLNAESELTIENSSAIFQDISSTADDILNEHLLFKTINNAFLEIYIQEKFKMPFAELDNFQLEELERVEMLLASQGTIPLSLDEKQNLKDNRVHNLRCGIDNSSLIVNALSKIKKDREWLATDQDLNYLSELFKIHLTILENGERSARTRGPNTYQRPTFAIDNLGNNHWITRLQIGYFVGSSSEKYANWSFENVPLSKKEIKKLLLSYTTGFISFFGRTHRVKAEELIAMCDNDDYDVHAIMQELREYMFPIEYNPCSSFLKRFEHLDARYRIFENDIFNKRDIERIFADYLYTGFCRNHLNEARRIINDCKNPDKDIDQIVTSIETYVDTHQFNDDSHFMVRFNKVMEFKRSYDEAKVAVEDNNLNII
jgi:hypothetical protein